MKLIIAWKILVLFFKKSQKTDFHQGLLKLFWPFFKMEIQFKGPHSCILHPISNKNIIFIRLGCKKRPNRWTGDREDYIALKSQCVISWNFVASRHVRVARSRTVDTGQDPGPSGPVPGAARKSQSVRRTRPWVRTQLRHYASAELYRL